MTTTALLLIDIQRNMFEPDPVYRATDILKGLSDLLMRARSAGVAVIFVRNNGGPDDPDAPGAPGWPIYEVFTPAEGELIIDKSTPDAFYQTTLYAELAARGIGRLVIAGMQTEYCIDTTTRRAKSLGFEIVLAADAHSTYPGSLSAELIIAHHNTVLSTFADVRPADQIQFEAPPVFSLNVEALTGADRAGIAAGLEEWPVYDHWIATGHGHPFWPFSHPGKVADAFNQLKDPAFRPRGRYVDPPRWEMGLARAFYTPLESIPMAFRSTAMAGVSKAIDHLLQNPRNPLSPHMNPVSDLAVFAPAVRAGEKLWLYDARDLRLLYVPSVTTDQSGKERRYAFLVWLAPGIPVRNPFM